MGLGASVYCLASCIPVLLPLAAAAEKPSVLTGLGMSGLYSVGRLIAYAGLFMAVFLIKEIVSINATFVASASIVSGVILIVSGLISLGAFSVNNPLGRFVCRYASGAKSPFYLGLMTGVRPCGPLIAAMTFTLTLASLIEVTTFVIGFWMASSLVFLAVGVGGGGLSLLLNRRIGMDRVRRIAGIAVIIIGILLTLQGIGQLMVGAV